MDSSEEKDLDQLSHQIEQRERLTRRRAWVISLIPILFAVAFLAYTIWQIAQAQTELTQTNAELASVDEEISSLRTQIPEIQTTLTAVYEDEQALETQLVQSQASLATATAQLADIQSQLEDTQAELDAARVFAQSACLINEESLKEFASNYTLQDQVLIFLLDAQFSGNVPWNPGGFSMEEGFNSPDFALYTLQNAISGSPLVSPDVQPGTPPWNILETTTTPQNGDIAYYQSGYSMFYYELPVSYGSRETMKCVIGMTPLGVIAQYLGFAQELGFLKVQYP
jgi:hypothetical protein